MKVLFLDIDGVLNSSRTKSLYGDISSPQDVIEATELTHDTLKFDKSAMVLLKYILEHNQISVVISSDWRLFLSENQLIDIFKVYDINLTQKLIGVTPYIDCHEHTCRGDDIEQWINHCYFDVDELILDDYYDFYPNQNVLLIDGDIGFGCVYLDKVIQWINS